MGKICRIHNLFVSIFISWSLMQQLWHNTSIKYKRFSYQRSRIDQFRLHAAKTPANPMKHKSAVVVLNKYKVFELIAAIIHLNQHYVIANMKWNNKMNLRSEQWQQWIRQQFHHKVETKLMLQFVDWYSWQISFNTAYKFHIKELDWKAKTMYLLFKVASPVWLNAHF